jgi:hypothetical protein
MVHVPGAISQVKYAYHNDVDKLRKCWRVESSNMQGSMTGTTHTLDRIGKSMTLSSPPSSSYILSLAVSRSVYFEITKIRLNQIETIVSSNKREKAEENARLEQVRLPSSPNPTPTPTNLSSASGLNKFHPKTQVQFNAALSNGEILQTVVCHLK